MSEFILNAAVETWTAWHKQQNKEMSAFQAMFCRVVEGERKKGNKIKMTIRLDEKRWRMPRGFAERPAGNVQKRERQAVLHKIGLLKLSVKNRNRNGKRGFPISFFFVRWRGENNRGF